MTPKQKRIKRLKNRINRLAERLAVNASAELKADVRVAGLAMRRVARRALAPHEPLLLRQVSQQPQAARALFRGPVFATTVVLAQELLQEPRQLRIGAVRYPFLAELSKPDDRRIDVHARHVTNPPPGASGRPQCCTAGPRRESRPGAKSR